MSSRLAYLLLVGLAGGFLPAFSVHASDRLRIEYTFDWETFVPRTGPPLSATFIEDAAGQRHGLHPAGTESKGRIVLDTPSNASWDCALEGGHWVNETLPLMKIADFVVTLDFKIAPETANVTFFQMSQTRDGGGERVSVGIAADGRCAVQVADRADRQENVWGAKPEPNVWHHLQVIRRRGEVLLDLDGATAKSTSLLPLVDITTLFLGGGAYGSDHGGVILDNVRFHDGDLSSEKKGSPVWNVEKLDEMPDRMPESAKLVMSWADRRWQDRLTGVDVVRISPAKQAHFRKNYFRNNMFTWDGRYAVFYEFERLSDEGIEAGPRRLWARDLISGELRQYGEMPELALNDSGWSCYCADRRSHRALVCGKKIAVVVDLDTGHRRDIVPQGDFSCFDPSFSADGRYVYGVWWKERAEQIEADPQAAFAGMHSNPGYQELIRLDLETGRVEKVASVTSWFAVHPNPNPVRPSLVLYAQDGGIERPDYERIRLFEVGQGGGRPLEIPRVGKRLSVYHEHWGPTGQRIYAHSVHNGGNVHFILCYDLMCGELRIFPGPPPNRTGLSDHIHIAADETFLVGDGLSYDGSNAPAHIRTRLADTSSWTPLAAQSGGGLIWKYVLPDNPLSVPIPERYYYEINPDEVDRFHRDLEKHPERTVKTTPICQFRSLALARNLPRLESNAAVTPDSRWVVFQSASEEGYFEIWAARVPGSSD